MYRMKFIVDQLPKTKKDCPFSELRELNEDTIYKFGYACKMDNKQCNLEREKYLITCVSCRWLKIG